MLDSIKKALRLTTTAHDDELNGLIAAAQADLKLTGIPVETLSDNALLKMAIITYCRLHFGSPSDYDKLKASYDEQRAQMMTATGYGIEDDYGSV